MGILESMDGFEVCIHELNFWVLEGVLFLTCLPEIFAFIEVFQISRFQVLGHCLRLRPSLPSELLWRRVDEEPRPETTATSHLALLLR